MTEVKHFDEMTLSEENYLKVIYHLSREEDKGVSTNSIAQKMQTKASSVTDMMRRLSQKKMVNYVKYQGVRLTEEGRIRAVDLVRRHRLWEVFLLEKLNFSWDEVHEVAEELEHIKSEKLIERLDTFLGYPDVDPHGDPIPSPEGVIVNRQKQLLSEVSIGRSYKCVGVKNSSKEFLQYLSKNEIALGDIFKVLSREEFDASLCLFHKEKEIQISDMVAKNIYVAEV